MEDRRGPRAPMPNVVPAAIELVQFCSMRTVLCGSLIGLIRISKAMPYTFNDVMTFPIAVSYHSHIYNLINEERCLVQ